ncbi:MAG TPA: nucleotidyltransferase family protein [Rubricoccaceae bacterium]|nr:nucleotidyltransferase family protein [Rubricoccaceae bacterium]
MEPTIPLPADQRSALAAFCRRWRVAELAVFGSALRADFGPGSDLDLLVTFAPDAQWGLWDHARMQEELEAVLGRPVDLLTRRAVERSANPIRRRAILSTARPLIPAEAA